jgi:hypothetical protein
MLNSTELALNERQKADFNGDGKSDFVAIQPGYFNAAMCATPAR